MLNGRACARPLSVLDDRTFSPVPSNSRGTGPLPIHWLVLRDDGTLNAPPHREARGTERMNTSLAEYKSEIANLDKRMAESDKGNIRWQIGLWFAANVILVIRIRWPVAT